MATNFQSRARKQQVIKSRRYIGKQLKAARLNYDPNMTQENVAQLFDPPVTRSAVAQWEVGETLPDIDRLAILSKAYGVSVDALIFGDDDLTNGKDGLTREALDLAKQWLALDNKTRSLVLTLILSLKKRR